MNTFKDYCDYFFSDEGKRNELQYLINEVTTNKTDFFREPDHFAYLIETVLPKLLEDMDRSNAGTVNIWSAGCSTGEEPYTLAMFLNEFRQKHPGFNYYIQASDISTEVLEKAKMGIYMEERIENITHAFKSKYFNKSRDRNEKLVRLKPFIRTHVDFKQINLMNEDVFRGRKFHIIFCRNVIIYFDRVIQERLIRNFTKMLYPSGYLFLGHSENICSLNVPLVLRAPTVYRKV
jgi:chemotaxis protein methyltransferase CheR